LVEKFPSDFSVGENKENQEKISKGKELILEEKIKRVNNSNKHDDKVINDLQSELNSLKNQPNSNEAKIKDLQRQINELKNKNSIPPKEQKDNNPKEKEPSNNGFL
jgi:chromosome segregation ATPase